MIISAAVVCSNGNLSRRSEDRAQVRSDDLGVEDDAGDSRDSTFLPEPLRELRFVFRRLGLFWTAESSVLAGAYRTFHIADI